jgi:hypothetical protein
VSGRDATARRPSGSGSDPEAQARRSAWKIALACAAIAAGAALLGYWGLLAAPLPEGALARIGGVVFDREDLEAYLGEPAAFESVGRARRAVDRFVGHQLLELAAQARGESADGLLERLVEERGAPDPVGEDEVRERYERDRHLYERKREVRIAYAGIPVVASSEGDAPNRSELRRLAEQILVRARLHPAREELALWIPRDETRAYALESGPWACEPDEIVRPQQDAQPRPAPELLAAACELREGRLTPVIETEEGFFIAKVRRRTRAWRLPFAKVARQIAEDLERERFEAARRAESERLRRRARVRTSPEAIASLVVPGEPTRDVADPRAPPSPPGFSEES